ncbi:MAG TPA: hypothetical protein VLH10_17400, partial [Yinghuangia sp.]|nr:hypothetical protein [Yinghuangia sp.]
MSISGVLRVPRGFSVAVITAAVGVAGLVPVAEAAVRVGDNYRLTSDSSPFRAKDMVALAVNPANAQHIVATHANYLTEHCEATASFDGGVTWSTAAELLPPVPPIGLPYNRSCRISNHLAESMAQTVAFGSGQNVYATTIAPRTAAFGEEGQSTLIYKSTNGGVTWGPGVISMPGGPSAPGGGQPNKDTGPSFELPTVGVDP